MSYSGLVEFAITDGTNTIDLLAANRGYTGFGVQSYVPGRPQLKDGGVWQDSPTESGRQLVFGVDTNIVDVVTLICGGSTHSQVIEAFEELDLLLQKMRAYWQTNWQQTPVYLQARAKGELARRYALIHYAKYDEYFNPYGQLFAGNGFKVCTEEFAFGLEHGLWLDLPPGQSESIPVTHRFNSGDPIDVTSSSFTTGQGMGLIVGNMDQAVGGLQAVFRDDGGSFSSNLLGGNPPYNLFNSPTAVNDAAYFGSTLPFYSLVFDFSSVSLATVAWEIWDGSTWTAITVNAESAGQVIVNSGITFARWTPFAVADWEKTTVGADETNRYWIRARLTGSTGGDAVTQANRHVYAPVASYVEVGDSEIAGTQSALLRIDMKVWNAFEDPTSGPFVIMGLRSVDRGDSFVVHLGSSGNPVGITATVTPATNLSSFTRFATWRFSSAIANQYYGQFRLFVRLDTDDTTGASQIRYTTGLYNTITANFSVFVTGEAKTIPTPASTYTNLLVDLGYINLPFSDKALYTDELEGFAIGLQAIVPSGKTITVTSLILMPADEWIGEINGKIVDNNAPHIRLDAVSNPKALRAYVVEENELEPIVAAKPFLHAGATQRLWFLFNFPGTGPRANATPAIIASVRLAAVQRNMSLRRFPL